MDNSYFIITAKNTPIEIERFHICSWEFRNSSALIEFGCEIDASQCIENEINIQFYLPWLTSACKPKDLYNSLKDSANSKFIFNDYVNNTKSLDGGQNSSGVIHEFSGRNSLCILPVSIEPNIGNKTLNIKVDLTSYKESCNQTKSNIYFRFYLEPSITAIATRKAGINKSTIIYDIKINERRNLPKSLLSEMKTKELCKISTCFCLNVVPNNYELTFLDNASLKNVRTLEFDSFNRYLDDRRVEKDELIVVFNKKKANAESTNPSFSFFSIYFKERIGAGQFALAVLINLLCGILLFLPQFREKNEINTFSKEILIRLPFEVYFAIVCGIGLLLYFVWPSILNLKHSVLVKLKIKKLI